MTGRGGGERLLRFGFEADRIGEGLGRQLAERADGVLERGDHRLGADRGRAAALGFEREHAQTDVDDRPGQRLRGLRADVALDQAGELVGEERTTLSRPMMPSPMRMIGSAAITTGMNCSTSATG